MADTLVLGVSNFATAAFKGTWGGLCQSNIPQYNSSKRGDFPDRSKSGLSQYLRGIITAKICLLSLVRTAGAFGRWASGVRSDFDWNKPPVAAKGYR